MKTTLTILALAGAIFFSCKKDRVCSCKDQTDVSAGALAGSYKNEYEYTMVKTGYKSAYYHCTHKKTSDTLGGATISFDSHCSLK